MRQMLVSGCVILIVTSVGIPAVFAQQRPPRPITSVFRPASVSRTQFSPDTPNVGGSQANGTTSNDSNSSAGTMPNLLPASGNSQNGSTSNSSSDPNSGSADQQIDYSQRPNS